MSDSPDNAACWFGEDSRPLYGWLHQTQTPGPDLGVVLCAAFGREELSTHQTLRRLALALSEQGMPVLRFDYPGCGDSYGDEWTPDLLRAWFGATGLAADHLRQVTGVTRIAFVGVRLGALLAAQAAARRADSAGLVAIMPPASGRAFVRELSMLGGNGAASDGTIEAGGYRLAGATAAALSAWQPQDRRPAPQALIIDHADLPASIGLARVWHGQGAQVERMVMAGLAQVLMNPHEAVVPESMVGRVAEWLSALAGSAGSAGSVREPQGWSDASAQSDSREPTERAVQIDAGPVRLAGVLTRHIGNRCRGAVVIPNAGAARRIGSGRMHVELARSLASAGWQVLRFDLGGLGDTPAAPGQQPNQPFAPDAVDELAAAVRWMQTQTGYQDCEVIGLCSGAYHAYRLAARTGAIAGFVAINPLNFSPFAGMHTMAPDKAIGEFQRYRRAVRQPAAWLKLIRGDVNLRHLGATLSGLAHIRVRALGQRLAGLANRPLEDDLPTSLLRMTDAGIRVRFVFAGGDPGDMLLASLGGPTLRALQDSGRVIIERVEGADHTFSQLDRRRELFERIERLIEPHPGTTQVSANGTDNLEFQGIVKIVN